MAFLSGLWMPLTLLPPVFVAIAPLWPAHHLAQLALAVVGRGDGSAAAPHVLALVAFTFAFFAIARRWLARAT
jgi:ABC-2 type transport system permease protein